MTIKEAYQTLGLLPGSPLQEVKKQYRKLMRQAHPDAGVEGRICYAKEINAAYAKLKETAFSTDLEKSCKQVDDISKRRENAAWNAPVNRNAYAKREILQYVEDMNGAVLGDFCVARGKYMWTIEEDFPLFLRSLYRCSERLLDEADASLCKEASPANRQIFQAELTYLLAQQFIDQAELLPVIVREKKADSEGNRIFYISAMLETQDTAISLQPGEPLYPCRIRCHRLYLQNQESREMGYLSFLDDRLYYIVVPLFEQKAVRIRLRVAEKQSSRKKAFTRYQNLHVWIKLSDKDCTRLPENLSLQIEQLLDEYKSSFL